MGKPLSSTAHATHFLALAEAAEPHLHTGPTLRPRLARLEAEHANLRAALAWCEEAGEGQLGLRLASALGIFWFRHSHPGEGRRWLERAGDAPPRSRAKALMLAARLAGFQRDDARAAAALAEAWTLAETAGDIPLQASIRLGRAILAMHGGDLTTVEEHATASAALFEAAGGPAGVHAARGPLGMVAGYRGDVARATALLQECLDASTAAGEPFVAAVAHEGLALVARVHGDTEAMLAHLAAALAYYWPLGERWHVALCVEGMALALAARRRTPERAVRLLGAAATLRSTLGTPRPPIDLPYYDRVGAALRTAMDEAAFAAAWEAGQATALEDAVSDALALAVAGDEPPRIALTPRERGILPLLAAGKTARQIGAALFLSHRTVEDHITHLYAKFGVRTRAEMVATARTAGLLPTSPSGDPRSWPPENPVAPHPETP